MFPWTIFFSDFRCSVVTLSRVVSCVYPDRGGREGGGVRDGGEDVGWLGEN